MRRTACCAVPWSSWAATLERISWCVVPLGQPITRTDASTINWTLRRQIFEQRPRFCLWHAANLARWGSWRSWRIWTSRWSWWSWWWRIRLWFIFRHAGCGYFWLFWRIFFFFQDLRLCNPLGYDRLQISLRTCSSLAPSPLFCLFLLSLAAVHALPATFGLTPPEFSPDWSFFRSHSNSLSLHPSLPPTSVVFKYLSSGATAFSFPSKPAGQPPYLALSLP